MQIKVIFGSSALNKKLFNGWGVSFLVDDKILFDTGEKGEWLLKNMSSLGVAVKKIEAAVISHDHWDHTGGLWEMLKERTGLKVYSCPGFSDEFKNKVREAQGELVEAGKFTEISQNVFITGEIPGAYHGKYMPEEALVLKTESGLTVITGCAHPGILKVIEKVKLRFPAERIYLVLGGFHLMESDRRAIEIVAGEFKKIGVMKTAPTHCSGKEAEGIFQGRYEKDFLTVKTGQIIEV